MKKMNFELFSVAALSLLCVSLFSPSKASAVNFDPTTISGLTNGAVADMVRTMASGGDYRAFSGASSLGLTGVDLGLDFVGIWASSNFQEAMALMTGTSASEIPGLLPLPRFSVRKGLPFDIDVGLSFIPSGLVPNYNIQSWGGEVKWTFLNKPLIPQVAARFTANYASLWFIDTHSYKFEVVGSKKFGWVEPYVAAGYQIWNGSLALPGNLAEGLPAINVSGTANDSNLTLSAGLSLKMVFMKLVAQYDYNTTGPGVQSIGGRVAFSF